jgi:hypothetical protein
MIGRVYWVGIESSFLIALVSTGARSEASKPRPVHSYKRDARSAGGDIHRAERIVFRFGTNRD